MSGLEEVAIGLIVMGMTLLYLAWLGRLAGPPPRRVIAEFQEGLKQHVMRTAESKAFGFYRFRLPFALVGSISLALSVLLLLIDG